MSFLAYKALADMAGIPYAGRHIFQDKKKQEIEKIEEWAKKKGYNVEKVGTAP